jgi:hypothetical protein
MIMPALFPIILATQIVLVADSVPKFDVEPTCRAAIRGAEVPERASMDCQQDEQNARSKLEKDWSQYGAAQRNQCDGLVTNSGGAPSSAANAEEVVTYIKLWLIFNELALIWALTTDQVSCSEQIGSKKS